MSDDCRPARVVPVQGPDRLFGVLHLKREPAPATEGGPRSGGVWPSSTEGDGVTT
jgi:hypothetical protein